MSARILLYRLEQELSCELRDALIDSQIVPAIEEHTAFLQIHWDSYDLVFCDATKESLLDLLSATQDQRPRLRVIAPSRLPDVNEWLDAVELGADDYCAAPFETSQIRWLITTHLSPGKSIAA